MRILQVRFKNLNSLVGEWEIDLTHPAFLSDGIFAITGPTGAGKTTLLDAICLALYGRTPRLNRVTKSGNEIMSRQTGECFAEVTFETRAGQFRCHWSQHRARRKAGGELQAPKHEIADAVSGRIFETKLRGVAEEIETATGMDFDRFTRSMLLAQGDFAAFLQAAPDERAPILEQITGTGIYSQISIRVHEKYAGERKKLDTLETRLAGMQLLSEEDEQLLKSNLKQKILREADLEQQLKLKNGAISWREGIGLLEKELASLAEERRDLSARKEAFQTEFQRLERAKQALELSGDHAGLVSLRREQEADNLSFIHCRQNLPELEAVAKQAQEATVLATENLVKKRSDQNRVVLDIRKVRELDSRLKEKQAPIKAAGEAISVTGKDLEELRSKHTADGHVLDTSREKLETVQKFLTEKGADAGLVEQLTGIRRQFDAFRDSDEKHRLKMKERDASEKQMRGAHLLWEKQTAAFEAQKIELAGIEDVFSNRELPLLETQLSLLRKIEDFEAARHQLQDGDPCPLCGATAHPYAEGNLPADLSAGDLSERLRRMQQETNENLLKTSSVVQTAEKTGKEIASMRGTLEKKRTALTKSEQDTQAAAHHNASARQAFERVKTESLNYAEQFRKVQDETLRAVSDYGINGLSADLLNLVFNKLTARRDQWQNHQKRKNDLEKEILTLAMQTQLRSGQISKLEVELKGKQEALDALLREAEALSRERQRLFGKKKPDTEEKRLAAAVEEAENQLETARLALASVNQELATLKHQLVSLEKAIQIRSEVLKTTGAAFLTRAAGNGFSDEADYLSACLAEQERAILTQKAENLTAAQTGLDARHRDKTAQLETEQQKKITEKPLETLAQEAAALLGSLRELQQALGGIRQKLSDNDNLRLKQQDRAKEIDAQKRECYRWETLHALIGSADGKKYRNFAQGLTFEIMIGHANRRLQQMTDRYLLVRDTAQPLELNVVDNYQAGEIRSTKNLSGGESFIVSLSLALGLSCMASKNVRVDSLFLDEGFGTLDEEALDTALETLAGLQQDGKLIGVISHVPALKERIGTRIQLIPQTGGRSIISGPGCRRPEEVRR